MCGVRSLALALDVTHRSISKVRVVGDHEVGVVMCRFSLWGVFQSRVVSIRVHRHRDPPGHCTQGADWAVVALQREAAELAAYGVVAKHITSAVICFAHKKYKSGALGEPPDRQQKVRNVRTARPQP